MIRRTLALLAATAAAAALFLAPVAARAAGVITYNARVCGTSWVNIHIPNTSYFNVYNDDFGPGASTCVAAEKTHLDFAVSSDKGSGFHAYPNISSGWESGRYSCTGHSGACYAYPVQEKADGNPVSSIAAWRAPGRYDLAYDIFFNQTNAHPLYDNGAEIMIWLAHPGIAETCNRVVTIDGIRWCETGWRHQHAGQPGWNLVIYYAVTPRSSASGLHLNQFFADAAAHGQLRPTWWLTAIDAGFELVSGGVGDNIHSYSLSGVR
jgi:hypothetical protein